MLHARSGSRVHTASCMDDIHADKVSRIRKIAITTLKQTSNNSDSNDKITLEQSYLKKQNKTKQKPRVHTNKFLHQIEGRHMYTVSQLEANTNLSTNSLRHCRQCDHFQLMIKTKGCMQLA